MNMIRKDNYDEFGVELPGGAGYNAGMSRPLSKLAPAWWDYTTLDPEILSDAARLTETDLVQLSRPGFTVRIYDTIEEFYLAEALEYIDAWQQSTADNPAGVCGPIGPTEQLPLVARIVNAIGLNLKKRDAHFWGMDEWYDGRAPVPVTHPLSFAKCDKELCFDRIDAKLRMPDANLHFPTGDLAKYSQSYGQVRCVVMQGGQGEIKHWAFNDPLKREGKFADAPPTPAEYRKLKTRIVDLHPVTIIQNARTSGGGNVAMVPTQAATVGPFETWKAERVSIWHPGHHDNPFGIRLSALMISKRIPDAAVPMSLLAEHPNVTFSYFRKGIGKVEVEMH
jgi:glucosamine-6-phosphate deaminase